jgi:hypothetical protein
VTEQEWLTCTDPKPMLAFLECKTSGRKVRLFAVACCRRIWDLLVDERSRKAGEVAELAIEGQASITQVTDSVNEAGDACAAALAKGIHFDLEEMWTTFAAFFVAFDLMAVARTPGTARTAASVAHATAQARNTDQEPSIQAALVRCIFGNPLRPVTVDPAWLNVTALARIIYDERSFDQMPDLADALEGAGCTNDEVLAHCREPGEHARGCWVVDLILGKE